MTVDFKFQLNRLVNKDASCSGNRIRTCGPKPVRYLKSEMIDERAQISVGFKFQLNRLKNKQVLHNLLLIGFTSDPLF